MSAIKLTSVGGGNWASAGTITICGINYTLIFSQDGCNGPCLTLVNVSGSPLSYVCTRDCCGPGYANFTIGDPAVCTGAAGCGWDNLARINFQWGPCNYAGPGWYCVQSCGSAGPVEVVELLDTDIGDTSIAILSGPYATEADALAQCPATSLCLGNPVPTTFTFDAGSPAPVSGSGCACGNYVGGIQTVTYVPETGCTWNKANFFPCSFGSNQQWILTNVAGVGTVLYFTGGPCTSAIIGGSPIGMVMYESTNPAWDMNSPLTLTRTCQMTTGAGCTNWPATITVYPG